MFLNKIFGSKDTSNVVKTSPEVTKNVGYYARKIAMALWLSAAVSGPALPQEQNVLAQKESTPVVAIASEQKATLEVPTQKDTQEKSSMKLSKALPWENVTSFMQRSFWVSQGWELLVEKDSWKRVSNPRTDLIAGKVYIFARNESEAQTLSSIFKKKEEKNQKVTTTPRRDYNQTASQKSNVTYHIPHAGFDFSSFLKAISWVESGGKYSADNSKAWENLKVHVSKHAKGKYQFTNETLANFWYATEAERKHFLRSPELQEKLMYKLTKMNYEYAVKSPSISQLLGEWVHMAQILATMHHRGSVWAEWVAKYAVKQANPVEAFFERLEQVKWDWLGTKTSKYVKAITLTYSQIAKTDITQDSPVPLRQNQAINEEVVSEKTQKPIPVKEVPTVASNDDTFDDIIVVTQNFTKEESKESKLPPTIELKEVASVKPVIEVLKETYKAQVLANLRTDTSIPLDVRKSLVQKLSKVDDLEAYYQEQIDYYNYILRMSRNDIEKQKAKRILPWLQKLLKDTRTIMASANDEYQISKKTA